jgi:hypothetical protein
VYRLFVDSSVFGFARSGGRGLHNTLLGDALWVRAFAGGRAGEGAIEPIHVNLPFASLRLKSGVHGGQELRPEFMEDLIDIDVRQLTLRGLVTKSTWVAGYFGGYLWPLLYLGEDHQLDRLQWLGALISSKDRDRVEATSVEYLLLV